MTIGQPINWVVVDRQVITLPSNTLSKSITTTDGCLLAVNIKETTASAGAAITFHDGQDVTGQQMVPYTLLANESARDQWPNHGIPFKNGLFAHIISGSIDGTVVIGKLIPAPPGWS